jgi:hypothetical protein
MTKPKIVLLGATTRHPVGGVVWLAIQYLEGFRRLGFDPYYVEAHACPPYMFMLEEGDFGSVRAAKFISELMERFDFQDRWAYHALHHDGQCYGMSKTQLNELYRSAALLINVHGATNPLPEHIATGRLVYLNTDPVLTEMRLLYDRPAIEEMLRAHFAVFTWGLNYGRPDCEVPVSPEFEFHPSPPPVVTDFWNRSEEGGRRFTTVGNFRQNVRYNFGGRIYEWTKDVEFQKFLGVPRCFSSRWSTGPNEYFELALAKFTDEDKALFESKGWFVRDALSFSTSIDAYRDYIIQSRGEFTVAKDLNISTRSGWFSERSATYLAAGRPVITQETGFSNVLPTGTGLFGFSTVEEIVDAVRTIRSDYSRHCKAALDIAREFFNYDVVLGNMTKVLDV